MKTNPFNYLKIIFLSLLLIIAYSCETEQVDYDEASLSELDKKAKRIEASSVITFDKCDQTYQTTDLLAGQNILVGNISVVIVGDNYEISYNITNNDYCLTSTHLSVVVNTGDFPMTKKGNPIPGQFEYKENHDCVTSYTYEVPTSKGLFIGAHAVVNCVDDVTSDSFNYSLPNQVNVKVNAKGVPNSYFNIEIATSNILSGEFDAWCVDQDASLNSNESFIGDVYSSYEPLPVNKFENAQNFGAVNWLMNQNFIGTEASETLGNYTFGDIQIAIWKLVDDSVCVDCDYTGPYNNERIDMLVALALEQTDFVPSCGENVVILLVPTDNKQTIFVTIPAPCGNCSETAWGAGCDFPGNNWFTYFKYG
ncbi:hypothetical protein [Algibacter mikhailovii]|uniref:DUF4249 family protein n=1 Tax=Algibacter mikhailovii TaxID=425498 RepID=A0A918REQ6_9FLAO|nr:hypothetical protein [Algibacter mikhailovii]GGZ93842.1 hypothetical protein GCM10007028_35240 [Algibacter mikhailovii]